MATEIASEVEVEAEKYTFAEICILHGQYPVEADKTLCISVFHLHSAVILAGNASVPISLEMWGPHGPMSLAI